MISLRLLMTMLTAGLIYGTERNMSKKRYQRKNEVHASSSQNQTFAFYFSAKKKEMIWVSSTRIGDRKFKQSSCQLLFDSARLTPCTAMISIQTK